MRISDADMRRELIRRLLDATPDEVAFLASSMLGLKASYDEREFCQWDVIPAETPAREPSPIQPPPQAEDMGLPPNQKAPETEERTGDDPYGVGDPYA